MLLKLGRGVGELLLHRLPPGERPVELLLLHAALVRRVLPLPRQHLLLPVQLRQALLQLPLLRLELVRRRLPLAQRRGGRLRLLGGGALRLLRAPQRLLRVPHALVERVEGQRRRALRRMLRLALRLRQLPLRLLLLARRALGAAAGGLPRRARLGHRLPRRRLRPLRPAQRPVKLRQLLVDGALLLLHVHADARGPLLAAPLHDVEKAALEVLGAGGVEVCLREKGKGHRQMG